MGLKTNHCEAYQREPLNWVREWHFYIADGCVPQKSVRKNRWLYDRKAENFIPKRVVSVHALIWVAILKDGSSLMIAMTTHQRFQLQKRGTRLYQL